MAPLLPNQGPPIVQTHEPVPFATLLSLRERLVQKSHDGLLTYEEVDTVAREHDVPRAQAYAALSIDPNLSLQLEGDTLVAICTGDCQKQGALENLEELLRLRDERRLAQQPLFEIIPRRCLDMCPHAPVMLSRSAHGQAAHPRQKKVDLPELISALCNP